LTERNAEFAAHHFNADLSILPTLRTMVISCGDPRVDPTHVLGLELGDVVAIRNIGGRITPATFQMMGMLGMVAQAEGINPGSNFNLVVLHHTDCGITRLEGKTEILAGYFGVGKEELAAKAITDPHIAVAVDVEALRANPSIPDSWIVSGLVYDVKTGLVETVVAPAPLRTSEKSA
jgi:carbonic anhydrase